LLFENFYYLFILEDLTMKMRMFLIFVLAAGLTALLVPSAHAFLLNGVAVDNYDTVLAPVDGTEWHDERGAGALKQNTDPAYTLEGSGSMMIDYSYWGTGENFPPGDSYDRVARRYNIPALVSTDLIEFWWYKADTTGPEHVRQMIFYSPGGGVARLDVATGGQSIPQGWQHVSALVSDFYDTSEGDRATLGIDWANVDAVDYWVSAWGDNGIGWWQPGGEGTPWEPMPGYEQYMPTGQSVFIDVPEPATMSLLVLGTLAMLKKRKA
jgi:hypothetical protein